MSLSHSSCVDGKKAHFLLSSTMYQSNEGNIGIRSKMARPLTLRLSSYQPESGMPALFNYKLWRIRLTLNRSLKFISIALCDFMHILVLPQAHCCQMWYAKEPHYAFSKRHNRVLVVIGSFGKHYGLLTCWRKAEKAGSLRTILTCIFRKDKHANTFRNPRHTCRIAGASPCVF